jgi:hypothetical protein
MSDGAFCHYCQKSPCRCLGSYWQLERDAALGRKLRALLTERDTRPDSRIAELSCIARWYHQWKPLSGVAQSFDDTVAAICAALEEDSSGT